MKTVKDMIRALDHVGVRLDTAFRDGKMIQGMMISHRVKGRNYRGDGLRPWSHLKWFRSGTGGGDGKGNGRYGYQIRIDALPRSVSKAVSGMFDDLEKATEASERAASQCRLAAQVAHNLAYAEAATALGLAELQKDESTILNEIHAAFCPPGKERGDEASSTLTSLTKS